MPPRQRFAEVEDTPDELAAFVELDRFLEDNPRELKRLVNVHRFVKILVQPSGGAFDQKTQRKLVKWVVFCLRWPDLVDDVLAHAQRTEASVDCLADCVARLALRPDTDDLTAFADLGEPLSAHDLTNWLAHAAEISQLVREEEAPRRTESVTVSTRSRARPSS